MCDACANAAERLCGLCRTAVMALAADCSRLGPELLKARALLWSLTPAPCGCPEHGVAVETGRARAPDDRRFAYRDGLYRHELEALLADWVSSRRCPICARCATDVVEVAAVRKARDLDLAAAWWLKRRGRGDFWRACECDEADLCPACRVDLVALARAYAWHGPSGLVAELDRQRWVARRCEPGAIGLDATLAAAHQAAPPMFDGIVRRAMPRQAP